MISWRGFLSKGIKVPLELRSYVTFEHNTRVREAINNPRTLIKNIIKKEFMNEEKLVQITSIHDIISLCNMGIQPIKILSKNENERDFIKKNLKKAHDCFFLVKPKDYMLLSSKTRFNHDTFGLFYTPDVYFNNALYKKNQAKRRNINIIFNLIKNTYTIGKMIRAAGSFQCNSIYSVGKKNIFKNREVINSSAPASYTVRLLEKDNIFDVLVSSEIKKTKVYLVQPLLLNDINIHNDKLLKGSYNYIHYKHVDWSEGEHSIIFTRFYGIDEYFYQLIKECIKLVDFKILIFPTGTDIFYPSDDVMLAAMMAEAYQQKLLNILKK